MDRIYELELLKSYLIALKMKAKKFNYDLKIDIDCEIENISKNIELEKSGNITENYNVEVSD